MADYDNRLMRSVATGADVMDAGLRAYMLRVYNYMLVGLGLTGVVAWLTASTSFGDIFYHVQDVGGRYSVGLTLPGMIAVFAPIAFVMFLSFRIQKMSFGAAQATFWVYAALMGISLATILLMYTGTSVALMFFVTAATFGAMSLYGYTTQRSLAGFGSFLFMGLIGVVLASVVNIFLHSAMMQFVISIVGVLVFTGLTAYDTQSIKNMYYVGDDGAMAGKKAVMGALRLYLDFINLFVMLVQLGGNRR